MNRNNNHNTPTTPSSSVRPKGVYPYGKPMQSTQQTPPSNPPISSTAVNRPAKTEKLQPAPVITNPAYLQGFLRTKMGKFMKVNFLLGTGTFIDKEGILEDVGVDHIVLREVKTGNDVIADLYSIKFVEIPNE